MMPEDLTHERVATWDAAYVLGALSPADRRVYEEHLRTCERCSGAVNELAGMPGLLGRLPRERGLELLTVEDPPGQREQPSADVLPSLLRTARRRRSRRRWLTVGIATAAAAVIAVLAFVLPTVIAPHATAPRPIAMEQVEPSALSADLRLTSEPWGTRIDSRCSYAQVDADEDHPHTWTYAMVVTDKQGAQTQVSTWTASEGTTVVPTATTSVALGDIAAIDIRSAGDGTVLLRSTFG